MKEFFHSLSDLFIALGPQGLLLLSLLDSAGIPMVAGVDALLIAVATKHPEQAYLAAAFAWIGSMAGGLFLFFLARKGGEALLNRHVARGTGKRLHLWFQRWGLATVFVPALSPIPLPLKIPVFCAGALQVRFAYFVTVLGIARAIRYLALAYLARRYGTSTFVYLKTHGWRVAAGALIFAVLLTLALRLFQRHEVKLGKPE